MPLSDLQKDSIVLAIDHLLDFSTDAEVLLEQIAALRSAILPTFTSVPPDNDYSQLIACLINPEAYLQRLETLNSHPITIAEVQAYILQLIVKNIYIAGKKAWVTPDQLLSLYSVYKAIPAANKIKIFVSEQAKFDTGENPNQLTNDPEQIYTGTLRIEDSFYIDEESDEIVATKLASIDVEIKVTTPIPINGKASMVVAEVPFLETDEEEDDFMTALKEEAQYTAEKLAATCAIRILSATLDLSTEEKLAVAEHSYLLIIQKFYFDLLINHKLDFAFLAALNETEVTNLLDQTVIRLLKNEWCDVNFASQLYEPQRKVLEIYYSLFKQERYLIECLDQLSAARCQFLIQPPIVRLIMQKRLSFEEACALPKFLKPLLIHEKYNNFFMEHEIDWDSLSRITPEQCELLLNPVFAELIFLGKIDINMLGEISIETIKMLGEYSYLAEWLKKGIVTHNLFPRMPSLYICAYSARLYAASLGKPFVLGEVTDTIDSIRNELYFTPDDCNTSASQLLQEILWDLLFTLKQDLLKIKKTEARSAAGAANMGLINKLLMPLQCIRIQAEEEPDCQAVFSHLLCETGKASATLNAQEYIQAQPLVIAGSNAAFFAASEVKMKTNELQKFCACTLKFVPFIDAVEALKRNSRFVSRRM